MARSSNPRTVGWQEAQQVILGAIDTCLGALQLSAKEVHGLSVCMAGVDRPGDIAGLRAVFAREFPAAVIEITNDALAALSAGTKGKSGVVLIAGTGSIAVGESASGNVVRAGGYGYLLGDEGSGFAIGRQGLMAAIQSAEGRGAQTILWEKAKAMYAAADTFALLPKIYDAPHPVSAIALFAKEVLAAAEEDKDGVANEIVAKAIAAYTQLIHAVLRKLPPSNCPQPTVVLAGGLFANANTLVQRLMIAEPVIDFQPQTCSSASGAALRAIKATYQTLGIQEADAVTFWQSNRDNWKKQTQCVQTPLGILQFGG